MHILRPHRNPLGKYNEKHFTEKQTRTHRLHSSEGVEPGFRLKGSFSLFLAWPPRLSCDSASRPGVSILLQAQCEVPGRHSLSNWSRGPQNLVSSLQMTHLESWRGEVLQALPDQAVSDIDSAQGERQYGSEVHVFSLRVKQSVFISTKYEGWHGCSVQLCGLCTVQHGGWPFTSSSVQWSP